LLASRARCRSANSTPSGIVTRTCLMSLLAVTPGRNIRFSWLGWLGQHGPGNPCLLSQRP
jgi:hypothetical protein